MKRACFLTGNLARRCFAMRRPQSDQLHMGGRSADAARRTLVQTLRRQVEAGSAAGRVARNNRLDLLAVVGHLSSIEIDDSASGRVVCARNNPKHIGN
jgi:hypothetical protein